MSGRPKQKSYQYDSNGKFIREFESIKEVQNIFYPNTKGIKNVFLNYTGNRKYERESILLTSGDLLTKTRIGRDAVKKEIKKIKSPFTNVSNSEKVIEVYNLDNQKIAEFKGFYVLTKMIKTISPATIYNQLKRNNSYVLGDLLFKYK